jgi:hypothetical protein
MWTAPLLASSDACTSGGHDVVQLGFRHVLAPTTPPVWSSGPQGNQIGEQCEAADFIAPTLPLFRHQVRLRQDIS